MSPTTSTSPAATSSVLHAAGIRRLLHDLKEVRENPVPNVTCLPLDDNLYVWHGNVRSEPHGSLAGAPIHFILHFPSTYPAAPPECRLLQPVPHPNVKPTAGIQVLNVQQQQQAAGGPGGAASRPFPRQARWKLSLWDCIPGKNSWCSSYSVMSILLQLQVFLMDEDLQYDTQHVTPEAAIVKAQQLDCPDCGHSGSRSVIHPDFPTQTDIEAARKLKAKQAVAKPFLPARNRLTAHHLLQHQAPLQVPPPPAATAVASKTSSGGSSSSSNGGSSCCGAAVSSSSQDTSSSLTSSRCSTPSSCSGDSSEAAVYDWKQVRTKKGKMAAASAASGQQQQLLQQQQQRGCSSSNSSSSSSSSSSNSNVSSFSLLRSPAARQLMQPPQKQQPTVTAMQPAAPMAVVGLPQQQPVQPISKAAKKNLARAMKRQGQQQQQQQQQQCGSSNSSLAPASASALTAQQQSLVAHQQQQQQMQAEDVWHEAGAKRKNAAEQKQQQQLQLYNSPLMQQLLQLEQQPMSKLIQSSLADQSCPAGNTNTCSSSSSSSNAYAADSFTVTAAAAAAAGPFSLLPRDAMLGVLCLLTPAELSQLSQTCRAMKAAVSDGALWQGLMSTAFGDYARLTASNMADWKAAFVLESAAVMDELRCWYTKASFDEDVLGLPLTYTLNPATGRVDYILAHPDVLSLTAFRAGVRETPQREKIDALLPLFLSADHFNRALPHMAPLLKLLAPDKVPAGGGMPAPEAWLQVLPKVLNTQVVLLADSGLAASQRTLAVYCQVHRLLLAVCEHWALWPQVAGLLESFYRQPAQQVKSATPNLGLLMPLLSLSPVRHSWSRMGKVLMEEALDRKVLWMCKKDPSLVQNFQTAAGSPPDLKLLRSSWQGAAVSCRLTAFHLVFLQLVACPRGSTLESVMDSCDAMFGFPAAALGLKFQRIVKQVQQISGWQEWYQTLGCAAPTAAGMSETLWLAWRRGAKKGYHRADMDFSRVQASGVSKILLKGQSYSTPPGTKTVKLEVHYKWRPEFHVRYLDGAVMLFGPDKTFLEMVAWNNQSSDHEEVGSGSVTHSGDIMEFDQQAGKNLADIRLYCLGPQVTEAYITLSAWSTAMLSDIIQPYVQMFEPSTGVELCQCHLDSKELATRRQHKCIIMARVFREPAGGWGVQSIGAFCQGDTSHVGEMVASIKAL